MPKLWLIGGGAFVAALLVVSLIIAFTSKAKPLPEGSPERAVQLFLMAAEDEDFVAAYDLFAEELKGECSLERFAQGYPGGVDRLRDSRVTYVDSRALNGSRWVDARVTQVSSSGPFGTSEYSQEHRYMLVQEEGEWRISHYTWPRFGCAVPRYAPPLVEPALPPESTATPTPGPAGEPEA